MHLPPRAARIIWLERERTKPAMKSLVMKSIYAGLGLLGKGKKSVQQLAREVAHKANISEKEGERIAKQLRHHSEKAIHTIQKALNTEVDKAVKAIHAATKTTKKRKATAGRKTHRRAARAAK